MGKEPVYADGRARSGTSPARPTATRSARSIAYAWLPAELAEPGTPVQVEYFGERLPAMVAEEPLFDPEMKRIRA